MIFEAQSEFQVHKNPEGVPIIPNFYDTLSRHSPFQYQFKGICMIFSSKLMSSNDFQGVVHGEYVLNTKLLILEPRCYDKFI